MLFAYVYDPKVDLNGDNASYYLLGKGLAMGEGYVGLQSPTRGPATHYPPGYPALIALLLRVFPETFNTVKVANGVLLVLALWLFYQLVERLTAHRTFALVTTLLLVANAHLLRYATIMMSEIPFLFASVLTLFAFVHLPDRKPFYASAAFWGSLLALGAAYYVRSAGVALLGGLVLYLLLNRRWLVAAAYVGGWLLMALPWQLRNQALGANSYVTQLRQVNPYRPELGLAGPAELAERVFNNLSRYVAQEIPSGCLPFLEANYQENTAGDWLLGLLLLALIGYGLYALPHYRLLVVCYLLATFGILLVWPEVWFGVRFLLGAMPLLLLALLWGAQQLLQRFWPKQELPAGISYAWLVLLLPLFGPVREWNAQARADYPPQWRNFFDLGRWAQANTPPETVFICRKPELFYLFSERPVTTFMDTPDDQALLADLRTKKTQFVVLEQLGFGSTARYLYPAIQQNPAQFRVVWQIPNPDTYLLEFKP